MPARKEPQKVLVLSKSTQMADLLIESLPSEQYIPITHVSTTDEAKRKLFDDYYDLIIINTPLIDDFGIQSAIDFASDSTVGILMFVKEDLYQQVCLKVEDYGIVTLAKPTTRQVIYSTLKMLSAMHCRLQVMERETVKLKTQIDEMKTITRAKLILMDQLQMSESKAHRYIEKQAMDRCVKKVEIAHNIIRTYER